MVFFLDENIPILARDLLVRDGHSVIDVRGTTQEGLSDNDIFALAQEKSAIFITTDKDFYHTIPLSVSAHSGVIVITLRQPNAAKILFRLEAVLSQKSILKKLRNRVLLVRDTIMIIVKR